MLKLLAIAFTLAMAVPAQAGWFDALKGNDTGGIIPWGSPTPDYQAIAANHCATYNKFAVVTSVPRKYGDYAGFVCVFPRDWDPIKARNAYWFGFGG